MKICVKIDEYEKKNIIDKIKKLRIC